MQLHSPTDSTMSVYYNQNQSDDPNPQNLLKTPQQSYYTIE